MPSMQDADIVHKLSLRANDAHAQQLLRLTKAALLAQA